jgi:transketolase
MGHHGTPVTQDHLEGALGDLDKKAEKLGVRLLDRAVAHDALRITPPSITPIPLAKSVPISFRTAVKAEPKIAAALSEKGALSPRRAFGLALKTLGAADPKVVALDADVKNSTYALSFAEAYPDRYFEARIAEQNMISVAAGLSSGGMIPFASTFGRFLERGFDQIEMAIIGGANLKLVGTHVGVTLASDGPSQMALADVAFMRAFSHTKDGRGNPAVTVLTPSDAVSAYSLVLAMATFPSACYLRAVRADLPILYAADTDFPFGGHKVLRKGTTSARRIVLVGCGYMIHSCLKAADEVARTGIDVDVVDAYALPFDTAPILALAGERGTVLTVEDSYVGGLGSELAEAAAAQHDAPLVKSLAVYVMPKSGRKPDHVLAYVHLGVADIVAAIQAFAR